MEKKKPYWLNTKHILNNNLRKKRPCYACGYCPYGQMIELFPITKKEGTYSCKVFGHNCPMYYHAENITEDLKFTIKVKK